jgi:chromosome partitioning protein|tara:strand:+ start:117594 stop:118232 length:639 start_codon:yes stop_codon:yes gene_type:complete
MRRIMVLNAKGGSGKTTLATNLASYFASQQHNVTLVDYDPQASSLAWLNERSSARQPITGIAGYKGKSVRANRQTDIVILDAPAAIHGAQLTALVRKAETILIPVLPSPIDMRAANNFIQEIKKCAPVAQKKAKIALVANRCRSVTNISAELEVFLSKQKTPFLTTLRDSQNYVRAADKGIGIFELAPAASAIDREQWLPIVKWLKSKRSQA